MIQLLSALALLASAPATATEPAAAAHQASGQAAAGHDPASVLMHHVLDQPFWGFPSKHLLFFVLVAVLVLVLVRLALRGYDKQGVPGRLGAMVESLVVFIRDEVAVKSIGHHDGLAFVPLLCSFFFFILTAALFGLLPFAATSTGNLAVTLALATVSFLAQQWGGIKKHGVLGHFGHLVPHGMPVFLLPIMIPVEILSMFTKPFALMIRLFANMLAGHMVITALLMLIPLMAQMHVGAGLAVAPVSLALSLFIMVLELLVALIQAYIFTLLTAIFIGMYVHPAH